ncbi:MAG: protein kinase family protein [Sporichthyaceae bacterium]
MSGTTPEVGTRLADRYRLDELVEKSEDSSAWNATDEKLARPVSVHVMDAGDLAADVITAAQRSTTVDDTRFVRVLDAVQRDQIAYVIYERLPEARSLRRMLATDGAMDPAAAQAMIVDATAAMQEAHAVGLSHLRLQPDTVLVTPGGQVKILGLCVEAALHSTTAVDPARADVRGLGRVLYAALTARWPEGEAFGLPAAPFEHGAICTPRQVRAGVPDPMDSIVDRVLNPVPRNGEPLATPADMLAALRALPRARSGGGGGGQDSTGSGTAVTGILSPVPTASGWKPSAATRGVQVGVIGLLVVGLILLGWQLVRALGPGGLSGDSEPGAPGPLQTLRVVDVIDFDPPPRGNGAENSAQARLAVDGRPGTAWRTVGYRSAKFGGLKPGVGLVLDLGAVQTVRQVKLTFLKAGAAVEARASAAGASTAPTNLSAYLVAAAASDTAREQTLRFAFAARTRFLLIWLTELPADGGGRFQAGISEVSVSS